MFFSAAPFRFCSCLIGVYWRLSQAHSSVEKASLIGLVKLRFLPTDDLLSLRGDTLREAVDRDREEGLIPFYVSAM